MRSRAALALIVLGFLIAVAFYATDGNKPSRNLVSSIASSSDGSPTPVSGPSWLKYQGLTQPQTHMGQMGGNEPIPSTSRKEPEISGAGTSQPFVLAGADIYRLNCRSCHGADGKGSPPEINSLLGPVQATSASAFAARMKARGTEVSDEMAQQMVAQATKDLHDRLEKGGKAMPAFNYLPPGEVRALLAYLDKLAGVPGGANAEELVTVSADRAGEQVVKGTCHICHDATGPGGGHMAMMRGIIPSLASLPRENSFDSFARQVHNGSSGMMMMMAGPRMPAFPYLTEEEIAAAYAYLAQYPPKR